MDAQMSPSTNSHFEPECHINDLFSFSYANLSERVLIEKNLEFITDYQRLAEASLLPKDEQAFTIEAYCVMCDKLRTMVTSYMYAVENDNGSKMPNWREHIACTCGFNNRIRAAMHFMLTTANVNPSASVYVTEQVTPLYAWLQKKFSNLQGSEYLGPNYKAGEVVNGIRHEDLCSLSFPDNSFDLFMSFDVLEHVSDISSALRHIARVTKDGGKVILQAPTMAHIQATLVRARVLDDGSIEHILPPEIHGNPVDPENGALCFRYFGVDVLDELRACGFTTAKIVQYWSRYYGYLGTAQVLIFAEK